MTIHISFAAWWGIPTLISVIAFIWWLMQAKKDWDQGGWFAGLGALFCAVPALAVIALSWVVGAVYK